MRISDWSSDVCSSDLYSLPRPETPFLAAVGRDPGRLRIAWTVGTPDDVVLHPECRAAVERAARLAAGFGHDVEEAAPEIDHDLLRRSMITIVAAHIAEALAPGHPLLPAGAPRPGGRPVGKEW